MANNKVLYILIVIVILVCVCTAIYIYKHDKKIKQLQLEALNESMFSNSGIPITGINNNLKSNTNNIINKYEN